MSSFMMFSASSFFSVACRPFASAHGNCTRKINLLSFPKLWVNYPKRYSSEPRHRNLMDMPLVMWPGLLSSIKNWMKIQFVVKKFIYPGFQVDEFFRGSKKAVAVVSDSLSKGDIKSLQGLVDSSALEELRINLRTYTLKDTMNIAIKEEDIYFYFIYDVIVKLDEKEPMNPHDLEICVCFHAMKRNPSGDVADIVYDYTYCNYAFKLNVQEIPFWTIKRLVHFNPPTYK